MKSLQQIGLECGTDKANFGYLPIYEDFFKKFNNKSNLIIAEIGVLGGCSLRTWRNFFSQAKIIGIDKIANGHNHRYDLGITEVVSDNFFKIDINSQFYLCDQSDENQLTKTADQIKKDHGGIDIFIDDGSHYQKDMMITFEKFFEILNSGGIYIFEDICTTEGLKNGAKWWGEDNEPKIENCVEQTILKYIEAKKIKNGYLNQSKITIIENTIKDCFFYKALTPPLTSMGTSSLSIVVKK